MRESRQTRKVVACSRNLATCLPFASLCPSFRQTWIFVYLVQAISPPAADVLRHAVAMLERLGATDSTGAQVTPLGAKLAKLQVQMRSSTFGISQPSVIKLDRRCEPFFTVIADISFFQSIGL